MYTSRTTNPSATAARSERNGAPRSDVALVAAEAFARLTLTPNASSLLVSLAFDRLARDADPDELARLQQALATIAGVRR